MDSKIYAHSNPIPLRVHKKSSNGCRACKKRKVKCDEKKPVCGNCTIHFSNIKGCDWRPTQRLKKVDNREEWHPKQITSRQGQQRSSCDLVSLTPASVDTSLATTLTSVNKHKSNLMSRYSCPCGRPEYTEIMLDVVYGICRICGNRPGSSCKPADYRTVMPDAILRAGQLDPFSVLPENNLPRMHELMKHWVDVLALFPTQIYSQYCTNPQWITSAISSPVLFNLTLYVSAIHEDGLYGRRHSLVSAFYKAETIRTLNEALHDPSNAVKDETLAAVMLLIHIVSINGESMEAEAHKRGLQQMIEIRGGIENFMIGGVFLHMLCTMNHLTAVLTESKTRQFPPLFTADASIQTTDGDHSYQHLPHHFTFPLTGPSICTNSTARLSPLLKPFSISCGFHSTVTEILYDMGYLYFVMDAFTIRLLPMMRPGFTALMASLEQMAALDNSMEGENAEWAS